MHNGDNAVNEVIGIYDCLQKAHQSMADCIDADIQCCPYDHISLDGCEDRMVYNFSEFATRFYDDQDFVFNVMAAKLWIGNDEDCCEAYQSYVIENRIVL